MGKKCGCVAPGLSFHWENDYNLLILKEILFFYVTIFGFFKQKLYNSLIFIEFFDEVLSFSLKQSRNVFYQSDTFLDGFIR